MLTIAAPPRRSSRRSRVCLVAGSVSWTASGVTVSVVGRPAAPHLEREVLARPTRSRARPAPTSVRTGCAVDRRRPNRPRCSPASRAGLPGTRADHRRDDRSRRVRRLLGARRSCHRRAGQSTSPLLRRERDGVRRGVASMRSRDVVPVCTGCAVHRANRVARLELRRAPARRPARARRRRRAWRSTARPYVHVDGRCRRRTPGGCSSSRRRS